MAYRLQPLPQGYTSGSVLYQGAWVGNGSIVPADPAEPQENCFKRFLSLASAGNTEAQHHLMALHVSDIWCRVLSKATGTRLYLNHEGHQLVFHALRTEEELYADAQDSFPIQLVYTLVMRWKLASPDTVHLTFRAHPRNQP